MTSRQISPVIDDGSVEVWQGDCFEVLPGLPSASVDAIVTDPPYGLEFMGRDWDRPAPPVTDGSTAPSDRAAPMHEFQAWCQAWGEEVLRVAKPGAHLLAFGSPRTHHRMMCGLEESGWEIRDTLMWLYGQGFPKSHNLDGAWLGWGTGLKPAWEAIVLARKPLGARSVAANIADHGTGALHIDACRVGAELPTASPEQETDVDPGRWPANVVLDAAAADQLDAQSGVLTSGANPTRRSSDKFRHVYSDFKGEETCDPARGTDVGGASRFFYCPKTPRAQKPWQRGQIGKERCGRCGGWEYGNPACTCEQPRWERNDEATMHPTVKPLDLMRWLVRLITPPDGVVLDPFAGTGTTGEACIIEGFRCTLIERQDEYLPMIEVRLAKPIQLSLHA